MGDIPEPANSYTVQSIYHRYGRPRSSTPRAQTWVIETAGLLTFGSWPTSTFPACRPVVIDAALRLQLRGQLRI